LRAALGASRFRVGRQFILDALVLAALGAAAGLGLAALGSIPLDRFLVNLSLPYWVDIRVDGVALAVAGLLTAALAVASGSVPAARALRSHAANRLFTRDRGVTGPTRWATGGLLVVQVTLSCALLIGAGLLVRSLINLRQMDRGFQAEGVISGLVQLSPTEHADPPAVLATLRDRVEALPDVESVSLARTSPGTGPTFGWTFTVEGAPSVPAASAPRANGTPVSHGYFDVMGIAMLQGRDFTPAEDRFGTEPVVIVSRTLAARYLGERPIGRRVRIGGPESDEPWTRVVGVVEDTYIGSRSGGIGLTPDPIPQIYVSWGVAPYSAATVLARGRGTSEDLVARVRAVLQDVAPATPLQQASGLTETIAGTTWAFELFSAIFMAFGSVALVMASAGLFGVVAFSVRGRVREVGIRVALGGRPAAVLRAVVGTVAGQVGAGLALGVGLSVLLARALRPLLFNVSTVDGSVYVTTVFWLLVAAALAVLLPARAALRVDPVVAQRAD